MDATTWQVTGPEEVEGGQAPALKRKVSGLAQGMEGHTSERHRAWSGLAGCRWEGDPTQPPDSGLPEGPPWHHRQGPNAA